MSPRKNHSPKADKRRPGKVPTERVYRRPVLGEVRSPYQDSEVEVESAPLAQKPFANLARLLEDDETV